ncbi:hypothetical protein [Kribbella solani]|uniref:Uncharacterized protein n=1 Tax=Kribbella solani TaxID=236067 RepID=A0A841DW29_9ACTN|nr:hypothetical protein [Kribbella solani]MBB5982171.1 hypothetical protein [Kribbella solani]MDX2968237.1 hypothetical protein [Kribbella solani]MDX3003968.1 hypothetical protein [Kribbella solani]
MQVTRKIVAAAAVATVATLGLATVVSANVLDDTQKKAQDMGLADAASAASKAYGGNHGWYGVKKNGDLVAIDDNNIGPFQACHLFGSGTGIGGNVPANDVVGVVGFFNNGNSVTAVKTCEQGNEQNNRKWYKADGHGVLSVSRNNVGPFQACHNELSATGIGGNVPLTNLSGVLGLGNDGNSVDTLKTCEQDSEQNN